MLRGREMATVRDKHGKSRRNFRHLRAARGLKSTPPTHRGAPYWSLTQGMLRKAHEEWRRGNRIDNIIVKLRRYSSRGITASDLRREWLALDLDIRTPATIPRTGVRYSGFTQMVRFSTDLQIQLAQETGLSRETVRARALRAVFVYGIDLRDPELILDGDPDEANLLPETKEI